MGDWLLSLPVTGMAVLILGAVYAFTAALYLLITALAVGERARAFKGISPGVLPPLSVIFALLVGFLAAQVWSDADRAGAAVNREASALRAVDLLGDAFPGDVDARLHDLLRRYIHDAVTQEWPAMATAERHTDDRTAANGGRAAAGAVTPAGESGTAGRSARDGRGARHRAGFSPAAGHPEPVVHQLGEMDGPPGSGRAHPDRGRHGAQR